MFMIFIHFHLLYRKWNREGNFRYYDMRLKKMQWLHPPPHDSSGGGDDVPLGFDATGHADTIRAVLAQAFFF
jgi:hypothetical protein